MSYGPCGLKELDMTEQLIFSLSLCQRDTVSGPEERF